jgi:exodeoxyribonuclease V alpha subunit
LAAIRGIGFKTADELAAKMGIDRNSPYRARAAVQYTLQEFSSQGHVGYPEPGVVEHTTKLVEIDQNIVEEAVQAAIVEKAVIREKIEGDSLVNWIAMLYPLLVPAVFFGAWVAALAMVCSGHLGV